MFSKVSICHNVIEMENKPHCCQGSSSKLQKSTRKTSQRQSDEATGSRGLFPNICMICKKELRVKSVCQSLFRIVIDTEQMQKGH
jgi:hypothetical protein